MKKIVYLVHCLDTEGPLYESIDATFERIKTTFNIDIQVSKENLKKIQRKELDLNGHEDAVATMVDANLLNFNASWDQIEEMLKEAMSPKFRNSMLDSFGSGWIYNWFCMDHIDFLENPRRRDIGYANVFDHYQSAKKKYHSSQDGLHFHFHPMSYDKAAHHCGTHYFAHSDSLFRILSYRVIERHWFPHAFRPGFNTIRPDSHWFLEQFIPFDFSNQSFLNTNDQPDLSAGRFGDWRRAPTTWDPYHPSHDDHETPGYCRRYIARCLNVNTRFKLLDKDLLETAFKEASEMKPVVAAFSDHDHKNIRNGVSTIRGYLKDIKEKYPDVNFKFCEAREAMRSALELEKQNPIKIQISWKEKTLNFESDREIFGPQPYFAIKVKGTRYLHDNVDMHRPFQKWSYTFDEHSIPLRDVEKIGIAVNDSSGNTTVVNTTPLENCAITHTW